MMAAPLQLPKSVVFAKEMHELIGSVIDSASYVLTSFETITGKVYKTAQKFFATLGILGALGAVFSFAGCISNISEAIHSKSVPDRIKNIFRAVVEGGSVWYGINGVLWALEAVGVIAAKTIEWTSRVNMLFFPTQIISLGIDLHDFSQIKDMKDELLPILRAKDSTYACDYVAEHHHRIRKFCQFSKATELHTRAQSLFDRLKQGDNQALDDAAQFINILKTRVNTKHNLLVADLSIKVAAVASTLLSIAIPANAASLCVLAISGIASLALGGFQNLLLNKNPFVEPSDIWHQRMFHVARMKCNALTNAIEQRVVKIIHCHTENAVELRVGEF